jgi:hypothetical protein
VAAFGGIGRGSYDGNAFRFEEKFHKFLSQKFILI